MSSETPPTVYGHAKLVFNDPHGTLLRQSAIAIRRRFEREYDVAISQCSEADQFCRRTGRKICDTRLTSINSSRPSRMSYSYIPENNMLNVSPGAAEYENNIGQPAWNNELSEMLNYLVGRLHIKEERLQNVS